MTTLVIGASSGIGWEIYCEQTRKKINTIGTYNNNNMGCKELIKLDLESDDLEKFVEKLKGITKDKKIETVIVCTGLTNTNGIKNDNTWQKEVHIESAKLNKYMKINCCSILNTILTLIRESLVSSEGTICVLSSIASSGYLRGKLLHNRVGGNIYYRISKAALNNGIINISYELEKNWPYVKIFCVHPGWVRTRSGGSDAPMKPNEAAKKIIYLCETVSRKQNGLLLNNEGLPIQL